MTKIKLADIDPAKRNAFADYIELVLQDEMAAFPGQVADIYREKAQREVDRIIEQTVAHIRRGGPAD